MISCNLKGGLGNQLFQIATTLALAWKNNDNAIFDFNSGTFAHKKPSYYRNTIFRNLDEGQLFTNNIYTEPHFHYSGIPYSSLLKLDGYFQSEKYFIEYQDKILDIFYPDVKISHYIADKYSKYLDNYNTVSIHFRRGDYLKYPNHHPILNKDYYLKAIEYFDEDSIFLIFSDDIEQIKNEYNDKRFIYIKEDDIIELYLMSCCNHNIICNSTFSWWGAWLNRKKNKKIIGPKTWFGPAYNDVITNDLIPESWILI